MRATSVTGAGGVDIEALTASRIKGRTVRGRAGDPDAWSVSFDRSDRRVAAPRACPLMAKHWEGMAVYRAGNWSPHLKRCARRTTPRSANAASPDLAEFLKDASQRERHLTLLQANAGDGQRVVNGLRSGDHASVYWVKTYGNPKIRNLRCSDDMAFLNGIWRSMESNCAVE